MVGLERANARPAKLLHERTAAEPLTQIPSE